MTETIPQGFTAITKTWRPRNSERKYEVIFRNGLHDARGYTASQLNWIHTGWAFDVVAVKEMK